mmetsp:Transcript_52887/g.108382  ORF Transcript_52887/g.108382 Transcript_52887/m.108382 type:complete len:302 (-) Transcript_52887:788-1693(-)
MQRRRQTLSTWCLLLLLPLSLLVLQQLLPLPSLSGREPGASRANGYSRSISKAQTLRYYKKIQSWQHLERVSMSTYNILFQSYCEEMSATSCPLVTKKTTATRDETTAKTTRNCTSFSIAASIAMSMDSLVSIAFCAAFCFAVLATFDGMALRPFVVFSTCSRAACWMLPTIADASAFTGTPRTLRATMPVAPSCKLPANPATPPRLAPVTIGTENSRAFEAEAAVSKRTRGSNSKILKAATEPNTTPSKIPPMVEDKISVTVIDTSSSMPSTPSERSDSRIATFKFSSSSSPIFFFFRHH